MRNLPALVGLVIVLLVVGCGEKTAGTTAVRPRPTVDAVGADLPQPAVRDLTATPITAGGGPDTITPVPTATSAAVSDPPPPVVPPAGAFSAGDGPLQVALVTGPGRAGDGMLGAALAAWSEALEEDAIPAGLRLWVVPELGSPRQAAGSRLDEAGIDPARNADVAWDGCSLSTWSADENGGPYPFAAPETAAAAQFLESMSMVVILEAGPSPLLQADACRQHAPTVALAERLRDGLGIALAPAGSRSGHLADYLAGLGVAAVTLQAAEVPDLDRVAELLYSARGVVSAAGAGEAEFTMLDHGNSQIWRFPTYSFTHPLAVEVVEQDAYLLDGGRVLRVPLDGDAPAELLLAPGDDVEGVRVLEPLDLATAAGGLLALDRAGDVYRYERAAGTWRVERYDRPVRDVSSQFYVAVTAAPDARYLLEASYQYLQQYVPGADQALWLTPDAFAVDADAGPAGVYVMIQNTGRDGNVEVERYLDGITRPYEVEATLRQPRQLRQSGEELLVLDRAGYRLQSFDLESGRRHRVWATAERTPVTAFWSDGRRLLLAGRDTLIFAGDQREITPPAWPLELVVEQPFTDPRLLFQLQGLRMPAPGSGIPDRPIRLPGAPRHYRLGVHAGLDLYWQPGTPIRAVAAGEVIQADVDYLPPAPAEYAFWRDQSNRLGYTTEEAADFYRGREIRIRHDDGTVSGYAHLSAIAPGVVEGTRVEAGAVIGEVGNSGSPAALDGPAADAHIHVEVWWGDQYLGYGLRPIETWEWLQKIYRNY